MGDVFDKTDSYRTSADDYAVVIVRRDEVTVQEDLNHNKVGISSIGWLRLN